MPVPDPYWAVAADWRAEPFQGASHRWAVGARSWEVVPFLRRPDPSIPIHICGEAWSDHQGWVEGALRSAERVVRDELGVLAPPWLARDAFLGP
jgi:monoamine oxidase